MIDRIAAHLDRLYPSQVDPSANGNGQPEAGHIGHEASDASRRISRHPVIGWYCAGGNAGHPICSIHPDDLVTLEARLAVLEDGALDDIGITRAEPFMGLRIEWYV